MSLLLMRCCAIENRLRIHDTDCMTFLDPLDRQRRDQCSTDTASVLGGQNLNLVFLSLWPAKDFAQRFGPTCLEVRVLVEHGAVGADVAGGDVLLFADTSDSTGGKAGGAGTNELGQTTEDFCFGLCD